MPVPVLYSLLFSLLTVVALIDWRTFEIPNGVNLAIFLLGAVQLAGDTAHWKTYLIGMFSVSLLFLLLWFVTKGNGLGMALVKRILELTGAEMQIESTPGKGSTFTVVLAERK